MSDLLTTLAVKNGGYFTTAQAHDCGYTARDLQRAVHTGVIRRLRRGTYAFAASWDSLSIEQRHTVLLKAVVAGMPGTVAASGVSACALHNLSLWGHDLSKVHIVRLDGGAGRREAGVVHHHGVVDETALEIVDGVPCVPIDQAMCEAAIDVSVEAGLVLFDSGLNRKVVTDDQLSRRATDMTRCPGTRKVRFGLMLADGRAQSPGETRNRYLYYRYHLPAPDLQVSIYDSHSGLLIGITDFGWELYHHLGEFDGLIKYRRMIEGDDREPEQVVIDEKKREEALCDEGNGMTRTIWSELDPRVSEATARRTWQGLERSRKRFTRNRTIIAL